ncbi:MAG: aminotransferase class I/II-fold pyridoxal phosphate-dependent enzyme [Phycisphaeraceae bacterium]|nr:aminotransferase class I/II-fold pyridoxal phosphate-dependent enzyme [Phycisphaeraceae bacterium]
MTPDIAPNPLRLDQLPGSVLGPANLVDLLRYRAQQPADPQAITWLTDGEDQQETLGYADLDRQARAIAVQLLERGMEGKRALVLHPPGLAFVAALMGCFYARVVAVPLASPVRKRGLERVLAVAHDAQASIALTTQDSLPRLAQSLDEASALGKLPCLATDEADVRLASQWQPSPIPSHAVAALQYTSGSTATPKGVILTHGNLIHNSALICHVFEHARTDRGVSWLPAYHDMGLVGGLLQAIFVGRPLVLMSPVTFLQDPFRWLWAITRFRGTTSGGPNFAYDLCVRKITPEQRRQLDLSSWSVAFTGAEPVRADTLDRFAETFAPCGFRREAFFPCYGLAEATLMVAGGYKSHPPVIRGYDRVELGRHHAIRRDDDDAQRLVGSGQNLPDQRIAIVDPQTCRPLPDGQVGEIWVHGPSIAQGYWNRTEETHAVFHARLADENSGNDLDFLRTGDLGFLDQGELFVTGRLRDLIIIRGRNLYPQDIERTVQQAHPAIRPESVAAFTCDGETEEQLAIVAEVERRREGGYADVFEAVARHVLAEHGVAARDIVLIKPGSMLRTTSGKVQRQACRQMWITTNPEDARTSAVLDRFKAGDAAMWPVNAAGVTPTGSAAATRDRIAAVVLEQVQRFAPRLTREELPRCSLADLGLDSLQRLDLLVAVERAMGVRLPEQTLAHLQTLDDVIDAVQAALTSPSQPAEDHATGQEDQIQQFAEYRQLRQHLRQLQQLGAADTYFQSHETRGGSLTHIDGRPMTLFSSYNYLGLADDPLVAKAAKAAIDEYGTSVCASRLVAGERPLHQQLESAIAAVLGTPGSLVFVGGHATNETVLGHLLGPRDLVLHDALAHNSIIQGCLMSGARRRGFAHNDLHALDDMLAEMRPHHRRVLIAVEGVYSMDGDLPDLARLVEIKQRHHAMLMVDEAHSLGVLGDTGRGLGELCNVPRDRVDIWMGTLSKALASCGGYIAGSAQLIDYLKFTAPGFVYSVGISPANAAAALAALQLLQRQPHRVRLLQQRADLFRDLARKRQLDIGNSRGCAIVPILIGDAKRCLLTAHALRDRGIIVHPIVPPAVPESTSRLRFFITVHHSESQIESAVDALAEVLASMPAIEASATLSRRENT